MRGKRRRKPPRRDATRRPATSPSNAARAEDQPLIGGFREALRTPDGIGMLETMGAVVESTRQDNPTIREPAAPVDLSQLVHSFIEIDIAETTAALYVLAAYTEDDVLRARMRRELRGRRQPMPEAVTGVADLEVRGAWRLTAPPYDVDDIVLALSAAPASIVVHVDRNVGIVADAFMLPIAAGEVLERFKAVTPAGSEVHELSPADARAHLEEPIDLGDIMIPPVETDTWPAARPLLRMLCRRMPEGGAGYPVQSEETDQDAITRAALGTRAAGDLDTTPGSDDADIIGTLVWLAGFLGFFEPLRWSPQRAEAMLLDLVPRKVLADQEYLRRVPEVLAVFVRAGAELGHTAASVADETVEVIQELLPEYFEQIGGPRRSRGDEAHRFALEIFSPDAETAALRLQTLERIVGGPDELDRLDPDTVETLVERPLDVGDAPQLVRDAAVMVDDLAGSAIGALADPLLQGEYRSAVRTLIVRLAVTTPDTLRRGKAANTAAALCWAVGRANNLLGEEARVDAFRLMMDIGPRVAEGYRAPETVPVKKLFEFLGVSGNVTARAATLLGGLGYEPEWVRGDTYALGDPALLTSEKRRRVALERDRWAVALE